MNHTLFSTTLGQMAYLLLLIAIGFILAKFKIVGNGLVSGLSKLENLVLIPALVTATFIKEFTREMLADASILFFGSFAVELVVIAVTLLITRFLSKDVYQRKIYSYGLCFSNFAFMGNAVVKALFPEHFAEYLIFTLALWVLTDVWAMPSLMVDGEKIRLRDRLKKLIHPMFFGMILGMILGVTSAPVPAFFITALDSLGACMSPVAMLVSGMIIATMDFKKVLRIPAVYLITFLRLIVYPVAFYAAARLLGLPETFTLLGVAAMAMPFGMNSIVIPSAYGKDVQTGSGIVLVTHLCSILSIPFIFWLISVW